MLQKNNLADVIMLSARSKSKQRKGSLGFIRGLSGSVSDVDNRVVMFCEDIPSEGSSWDSGRGSHSSGALSSIEELGHGRRSRSFHGREDQSGPTRPMKHHSVREVRHGASSVYGRYPGQSTPRIRELYEIKLTAFAF